MVCGTSRLPLPGCTGISAHLVVTQKTSQCLENLQVEQVLTSRWQVFSSCSTNFAWHVIKRLRVTTRLFHPNRFSLPTIKGWSSEPSPRAELPFAHGPLTRTHGNLLRRYAPSDHFQGSIHGWKVELKSCPQVAVKVGCPTDNRMAACLKMSDPARLTLAGTLSLASSPDSKACTSRNKIHSINHNTSNQKLN